MHVKVGWSWVEDETADDWNTTDCLYAFTDPESDEVLYLGTCSGATLKACCEATEHEDLWSRLRGIEIDNVGVMIGRPQAEGGAKIDAKLLGEITQLLVFEIGPSGNSDNEPRVEVRPGLEVACSGEWPYEEAVFVAID